MAGLRHWYVLLLFCFISLCQCHTIQTDRRDDGLIWQMKRMQHIHDAIKNLNRVIGKID